MAMFPTEINTDFLTKCFLYTYRIFMTRNASKGPKCILDHQNPICIDIDGCTKPKSREFQVHHNERTFGLPRGGGGGPQEGRGRQIRRQGAMRTLNTS